MQGNIHSFETFATLDGGGIRFAIFLQGCPLRCVYCHNPDTQATAQNKLMSVDEIVAQIARRKHYYASGGVTVTGGEPLLQSEFLKDLISAIKTETGLHVALDTSLALLPDNFDSIAALTDLFIVDLKFWDEASYRAYSGGSLSSVLDGLRRVDHAGKQILLRTVIVPGVNDTPERLDQYLSLIKNFKNIYHYELLGYHTLGAYKYDQLERTYPLEGVPALDKTLLAELQQYVNQKLPKR